MLPASWGEEDFISLTPNPGTLYEQPRPYTMLWVLSAIYFVAAYLITRYLYPTRKPVPTTVRK